MSTTVRDRLLERIGEHTFVDVFHETCDAHGDEPALVERVEDGILVRSWRRYREEAVEVAVGLRRLGVEPGGHVALMLANHPEHVICDMGTLLAGAVPTSVYREMATDQLVHVATNSGATVAVVEDGAMLERWLEVRDRLEDLQTLVVLRAPDEDPGEGVVTYAQLRSSGGDASPQERAALEGIRRDLRPDDPATLIYTSGTTGTPKGAIITHRNVLYQLEAMSTIFDLRPGQRVISYLPLAHIAERVVSHYLGVGHALTTYFVPEITGLLETLQGARPHLLFGVPRVWEKTRTRLQARVDETPSALRRRLALAALETGRRRAELRLAEEPVPLGLRWRHAVLDRLVLGKIRRALGLDRIEYVASGAAPLDPELMVFFAGIGLEVLDVYGMSESTAVITCNRPGAAQPETVGWPVPGTHLEIAEDGEILSSGPHVFAGYHRREDATHETLAGGWLHTGDVGVIEPDGRLRVIGRKKDLLVTSTGENVAPTHVEDTLRARSPIIGQVCAVGDQRPYVATLVALDPEALPEWCRPRGLPCTEVATAAAHPEIAAEIARAVEEANRQLGRHEQIRQWTIMPAPWTVESNEVTPTQKLRRKQVLERHAEAVEKLYAGG